MKSLTIALLLSFTFSSFANDQVLCKINAKLSNQNIQKSVTIDLHEDYRYLTGKTNFSLLEGTVPGSIEILTWKAKGGRVFQNTLDVATLKISNAGLKTSASTDGVSILVDCKLNLEENK